MSNAFADLRALAESVPAGPWFAQPDDTIGGWCVTTEDVPPSEGARVVAEFVSEDVARFIALARTALPLLLTDQQIRDQQEHPAQPRNISN